MAMTTDWRPSAAYFYLLYLDGPALAWEYLRRNPDYQRDRQAAGSVESGKAQDWGLKHFENPALDACVAHPNWLTEPASSVRIIGQDNSCNTKPFSLWDIPGRKSGIYDGTCMLFTSQLAWESLRFVLENNVQEGLPYAFALPAADCINASWRAVSRLTAAMARHRRRTPARSTPKRPGRDATFHMRALQALDGFLAGATQREIATAIFGADRVKASWQPGSDLHSQVRHLIHRSNALMKHEYRTLLSMSSPAARR